VVKLSLPCRGWDYTDDLFPPFFSETIHPFPGPFPFFPDDPRKEQRVSDSVLRSITLELLFKSVFFVPVPGNRPRRLFLLPFFIADLVPFAKGNFFFFINTAQPLFSYPEAFLSAVRIPQ